MFAPLMLMAMLRRSFSLAPGGEYSIEVDPRTVDARRLAVDSLGPLLGDNARQQIDRGDCKGCNQVFEHPLLENWNSGGENILPYEQASRHEASRESKGARKRNNLPGWNRAGPKGTQ